jgi:hypothetical protein
LNHNIESFKTYNELGVRRKYKPAKKRLEKFRYNNEWESDSNNNVFTLRDYKCCYITIMKNKIGNYEPRINGSSVSDYPDVIKLYKEYSNLEQAKKSAFIFVDTVTKKNK